MNSPGFFPQNAQRLWRECPNFFPLNIKIVIVQEKLNHFMLDKIEGELFTTSFKVDEFSKEIEDVEVSEIFA